MLSCSVMATITAWTIKSELFLFKLYATPNLEISHETRVVSIRSPPLFHALLIHYFLILLHLQSPQLPPLASHFWHAPFYQQLQKPALRVSTFRFRKFCKSFVHCPQIFLAFFNWFLLSTWVQVTLRPPPPPLDLITLRPPPAHLRGSRDLDILPLWLEGLPAPNLPLSTAAVSHAGHAPFLSFWLHF